MRHLFVLSFLVHFSYGQYGTDTSAASSSSGGSTVTVPIPPGYAQTPLNSNYATSYSVPTVTIGSPQLIGYIMQVGKYGTSQFVPVPTSYGTNAGGSYSSSYPVIKPGGTTSGSYSYNPPNQYPLPPIFAQPVSAYSLTSGYTPLGGGASVGAYPPYPIAPATTPVTPVIARSLLQPRRLEKLTVPVPLTYNVLVKK